MDSTSPKAAGNTRSRCSAWRWRWRLRAPVDTRSSALTRVRSGGGNRTGRTGKTGRSLRVGCGDLSFKQGFVKQPGHAPGLAVKLVELKPLILSKDSQVPGKHT